MKILATFLLVVAFTNANSIKRYGWAPGTENVFRFESQVLTGIPDIDNSQFAGVKVMAKVRVQSFQDYTLRIQIEDSKLITLNGKIDITDANRIIGNGGSRSGSQANFPQEFKSHLESPMLVHLKRGLVENFYVAQDEPVAVTNLKRSLLSQLQLDVTGSQQRVENAIAQISGRQGIYHKVLEESVQGKCTTMYNVVPLTPARVMELERSWYDEETMAQLTPSTEGKNACENKQYYEIIKTRDLDHCSYRPVFQHVSGAEFSGDVSKSHVGNLVTHMSSSTTYVCGELSAFDIRKIVVDDQIVANPVGYNTEQKEKTRTRIMLELIKKEAISTEIPKPSPSRKETSLVYAYPEQRRMEHQMSSEVVQKTQELLETIPVLPQPTLEDAPKLLIPAVLPRDQVISKIVTQIKTIAQEIFESPESCTSKLDVSGKVVSVAKLMQVLSLQELQQAWTDTLASVDQQNKKAAKYLLLDAVAMTGTNPATMFVLKKIDAGEICFIKATATIQSAMKSIRTPTKELVNEILKMVQQWKNDSNLEKKRLLTPTLLQLSNLIFRAYVNPSTMVSNYPVRMYGIFGTEESSVVQDYVTFLKLWLEQSEQEPKRTMKPVIVTAMGKLGALDAIKPLLKVAQGVNREEPLYRSLAVYSLKRAALKYPTELKTVLLAIINNPVEYSDVRIAAISVLPWTQPSHADLQQIAVRSWYDTSNQVSAYARSTFKSLINTEVPELKAVGVKMNGVIHMFKTTHYGLQFSKNFQISKFVRYLLGSVNTNLEIVQTKDANGPSKIARREDVIMEVLGEGIRMKLNSWSSYGQGFERAIDYLLYVREWFGDAMKTSPMVVEELKKIANNIQLTPRALPEFKHFIKSYTMGYEYAFQVTSEQFLTLLTEMGNSNIKEKLAQGTSGDFVTAADLLFTEFLGPNEMGLPMVNRKDLVSVLAGKAFAKTDAVGYGVTASFTPVWNIKHQSDNGVVSPFNNEYIGDGVAMSFHTSLPIQANIKVAKGELDIQLKAPQQVIAGGRSAEIVHGLIVPYTVRAQWISAKPFSKSRDFKEILSGAPLKRLSKQFNGLINGEFKFESDNEFVDFYSYWEKIKQHTPLSLPATALFASSVHKSSTSWENNPSLSELKEVSLKLKLYSQEPSPLMKLISKPVVQSIKEEIQTIPSLKKVHEMLHQDAPATIVKVEASLKETSSTKKMEGYAVFGYKHITSHHVKSAAAVAGKLEQGSTVYGILYEGELKRPKINARWNKEQILNQPLELFYNGKIVYGLEHDQQNQQKIVLKSKFLKTQEQIQSVHGSAEFKKCDEVALAGRRLSPICIKVRHQAGSLDRAEINLEFPQKLSQSPWLATLEDVVKAKFFAHYKQILPLPQMPSGKVKLILDVARAGDVAHVVVNHLNNAYNLTSIRIPYVAQGVMPLRVRNPVADGIEQKLTNSYAPASCRVEPKIISTFDNKTYEYKINDCEHVLLIDGQKTLPVAVLTRTITGEQKMVRVLSGQAMVEVIPDSSTIKIKIDGVEKACPQGQTIVKKDHQTGEVIVEVKHYKDGVYHIYAPQQMMHVITDGKSIEVIAPQLLKNRASGLCGDMNGEEIADLPSPKKCIMQPKLVAISYILNKNGNEPHFPKCNSIKPQDLQEYKREEQKCTKEAIVPTPILKMWERAQRMNIPLVAAHKVEKQMNKVCISKEKVKTCGGSPGGLLGSGMKKEKMVKYACISAPSSKAESLKKRAMVGDSLGIELNGLATSYTKIEAEALTCGGFGAESGSDAYGMGGGYGSGSGREAYGMGEGYGSGSGGNAYGMGGGHGSGSGSNGYGMGQGHGSGSEGLGYGMEGEYGSGSGNSAFGMGGWYRSGSRVNGNGMRGGYVSESGNSGDGMGGGYESESGIGGNRMGGGYGSSVDYEKIELGTLCTNEAMDEIRSENECKAAAHRLGLQWAQSWNGHNDFPGCLYAQDGRNKVYFNKSPSPARTNLNPKYSAICRARSTPSVNYQKIQRGTLCTSQAMEEIRSPYECKTAAQRLGLQWGQSWNGPNDFPGCLYAQDGRNKVYFNTSFRPARTNLNPKYSAICRARSTPSPDTSGMVLDPQNNNKKCGPDGSSKRVFDLRGYAATESKCKEECMKNDQCVAFSARWGKWCIGCKVNLDEPTVHPSDQGAIAFKKLDSPDSNARAAFFGCKGSKIALKVPTARVDDTYIMALPDRWRVNADGSRGARGTEFVVEDLGDSPTVSGAKTIALKSIYGKYLAAHEPSHDPNFPYPNYNVTAGSTFLWKGAKFEVKHNSRNQYWFKTAYGRYLIGRTDGTLRGNGTRMELMRWAKFTPECLDGRLTGQLGGVGGNEEFKTNGAHPSGSGSYGAGIGGGSGLLGCASNEFECKKSGICIPMSYRCDGEFDCGTDENDEYDNSDEENCGYSGNSMVGPQPLSPPQAPRNSGVTCHAIPGYPGVTDDWCQVNCMGGKAAACKDSSGLNQRCICKEDSPGTDVSCPELTTVPLGSSKCDSTEDDRLNEKIWYIDGWNNGESCRAKCAEHGKIMGEGCCEARQRNNFGTTWCMYRKAVGINGGFPDSKAVLCKVVKDNLGAEW